MTLSDPNDKRPFRVRLQAADEGWEEASSLTILLICMYRLRKRGRP